MVFEKTTSAKPSEVLDMATEFFGERVPHHAAFPEKRSDSHLVLRGQGGEEVAIAARMVEGACHVRGSTLMFDHALDRFLTTLPDSGTAK